MNECKLDMIRLFLQGDKIGSFARGIVIKHNIELATNIMPGGFPLNGFPTLRIVFPKRLLGQVRSGPIPHLKSFTWNGQFVRLLRTDKYVAVEFAKINETNQRRVRRQEIGEQAAP